MTCNSIEPRDRIFGIGCGFLPFAEKWGEILVKM